MSFEDSAPAAREGCFIALSARTPHGRAFGAIKHPKLQGIGVSYQAHLPAKGIYLPDYLPLSYSTDRRITAHLRKSLHIHRNQQYLRTELSGSKSSFTSCVTSPDNYNIIIRKHLNFLP